MRRPRPPREKYHYRDHQKGHSRRNEKGEKLYCPYGYRTTIAKFGHLVTWKEMSPKERYVTSLRIKGSRNRNLFWKSLGYPNLKKALEVRMANREKRIKEGILPPKRVKRLEKIVAEEVKPVSVKEERTAELWLSGKVERVRKASIIGEILPTGLYDPAYLMRREMRILEVMGRCPA